MYINLRETKVSLSRKTAKKEEGNGQEVHEGIPSQGLVRTQRQEVKVLDGVKRLNMILITRQNEKDLPLTLVPQVEVVVPLQNHDVAEHHQQNDHIHLLQDLQDQRTPMLCVTKRNVRQNINPTGNDPTTIIITKVTVEEVLNLQDLPLVIENDDITAILKIDIDDITKSHIPPVEKVVIVKVTPSDRSLSPVVERREVPSPEQPEQLELSPVDERVSHSPSRRESKHHSSRSKHSHRRHHRSHRESSRDHDRHKSKSGDDGDTSNSKHESTPGRDRDPSQHKQNSQDGDKDGDVRRRSIYYEDDIEKTTRQAERERDQQRWR